MKLIREVKNLKDKKVLLRTDFDVPVSDGKIEESFRIKKQKAMIDYLLERGAKVTMVSHISAIPSFEPILKQLEELIGHEINFSSQSGQLNLLDNVRQDEREQKNDEGLALNLSKGFDLYVNNAFAVCHRKHASVSAIANIIPGYAGLLVEEEVTKLGNVINSPPTGKVIILGGAKTKTKVPVIKNLIDKAEKVIIGGVIANDMMTVRGYTLHISNVDPDSAELLADLNIDDPRLVLPVDFLYSPDKDKIWDIGPKSSELFKEILEKAKMVVWNGPVGFFEEPGFEMGTFNLAKVVAGLSAEKIIGGGDTISAVSKAGFIDKFDLPVNAGQSFISTGGGAMLDFLAGEKMPGLEALGYYE